MEDEAYQKLLNDEINEHLYAIELGNQAVKFWKSEIGQHIISSAEANIQQAIKAFLVTSPSNTQSITDIQVEIKSNINMIMTLKSLIINADDAEQSLHALNNPEYY
ncbi:hypothetical protein KCM76_23005 [Zooshikella marina]|uniref:hypothetical protein n=1 Tax=Zooshikella ganghwensis TaxID=202772 RepID=UPI001BB027B3|nr:hypothetical protein [Zooshikella ganghwensis]MBU2708882.1 hypothetical protein [Zooshikella ganghwensis]